MISLVFFVAMALCMAAAGVEFRRHDRLRRQGGKSGDAGSSIAPFLLWVAFALLLGALGVNRETGFLAAITDHFRTEAKTEGWYNQRRAFQQVWVRRTPYIGAGGFLFLLLLMRRHLLRLAPALIALTYLVCFSIVEGISFHNTDWLLRQRWHSLQYRTWGDAVGIGLTLFALLWFALLSGPGKPLAERQPRRETLR